MTEPTAEEQDDPALSGTAPSFEGPPNHETWLDSLPTEVPTYPVQWGGQSVSQVRKRDYRAWVGGREDLLRVHDVVADANREIYDKRVAELEDDQYKAYNAQNLAESLRTSSSVLCDGGERRYGDLRAILDSVDCAAVQGVVIGGSDSAYPYADQGPQINVRFGPEFAEAYKYANVQIAVHGEERNWVAGNYDRLTAAISRGVPWWSFMRNYWVALGLTIATVLGLGGVASLLGWAVEDRPTEWLVIGALAVFSIAASAWVNSGLMRAFPSFQLLNPGQTDRGRAVMGFALGVWTFLASALGMVAFFAAR